MPPYPATKADLPAIVALVNSAYRGDSSRRGWTTEADYLDGQRIDLDSLQRDLAAQPDALILTLRDLPDGEVLACVLLEPTKDGAWYIGMLTVRPDLQARRLGRAMLNAAEARAAERGARLVRMSVVGIRDTLIAWYERRGYVNTGRRLGFPYGDERFGIPRRDDLDFVVMEKAL